MLCSVYHIWEFDYLTKLEIMANTVTRTNQFFCEGDLVNLPIILEFLSDEEYNGPAL